MHAPRTRRFNSYMNCGAGSVNRFRWPGPRRYQVRTRLRSTQPQPSPLTVSTQEGIRLRPEALTARGSSQSSANESRFTRACRTLTAHRMALMRHCACSRPMTSSSGRRSPLAALYCITPRDGSGSVTPMRLPIERIEQPDCASCEPAECAQPGPFSVTPARHSDCCR